MGADVKMLAEVGGMSVSALVGMFAVADSTAMTVGSIGAVLGFAGLLVRQIMQNQKAIWSIVAHKDAEIVDKDRRILFLEWEREKLRWTYGDRATDPGPPPASEGT